MSHSYRHAIIVGASSGVGAELARLLAEQGCRVAVLARRLDRLQELAARYPDQILPFHHDVTDYAAVPALFQEVTGQLGGLDLIVYSSGVMPEVGPNEFTFEKDRQMVEVNVLGAIAWLNQAAIRFQNTRRGTIVGISSVAGDRGRAGQPVYNTSKAALSTYLEALRNRLAPYGVIVSTIKPGPMETEMTQHLKLRGAMPAADAAAKILTLASRNGEHYLKLSHQLIFFVIRHIPSWLFRRLPLH